MSEEPEKLLTPAEAVEAALHESDQTLNKLLDETLQPVEPERVSDEELEKLAAAAKKVLEDSRLLRQCVGSMVAARQLYAMCIQELDRQMEKLPEDQRHPDLTDYLIQATTHQAAQPFNEQDLYAGFQETVYPWMVDTVDRHNREDKRQRQDDLEAFEQQRRSTPLPIKVTYDPELGDRLPRDRALVLVGWTPAVQYLLDNIVNSVLAANDPALFCVIRLQSRLLDLSEQGPDRLYRLDGRSWENCCRSGLSWPRLFQQQLLRQMEQAPDLLICDDLARACRPGGSTEKPTRQAAESHKRLREWCLKVGTAMIGGVPLDHRVPPDLSGTEWSQLRTWSWLRPVWVEELENDPLYYNLYVGRDNLVGRVPRRRLDEASSSPLIIP
jgi:hypothetical protein